MDKNVLIILCVYLTQADHLLSRMSFGVYIIHPLLITIAKLIMPYHVQPLRYMLLLYLVVVCLSFLICYLFSKVPLARKLVRM